MAHLNVVAIPTTTPPTPKEFIFHNVAFGISFPPLSPAATCRRHLQAPAARSLRRRARLPRLSNTGGRGEERGGRRGREREASLHVVEMTQINIHYLNQTKINGSLSLQLSPTVSCRVLVGQNQH